MNEITKLYKNAGIKPIQLDYPDNIEQFYPEFTAEKQLNLIKFVAQRPNIDEFKILFRKKKTKQVWVAICVTKPEVSDETIIEVPRVYGKETADFAQCLAGLINLVGHDLTAEEKEQIKDILK